MKIKQKNMRYLIGAGLALLLVIIGFGYWYSKGKGAIEQNQNKEQQEIVIPDTNADENSAISDNPAKSETKEEVAQYVISGVNKKDGDILSVPDDVTFSIAPKVDKTKITLKNGSGDVLYFETRAVSSGTFTVYPAAKLTEGSAGTITLEGYVGSNVVITKVLRIVF